MEERKKYDMARTKQREENGAVRRRKKEERNVLSPGKAEHNLVLLGV